MKKNQKYCFQCFKLKENFPIILKKQKKICTECYISLYGKIENMEEQRKKTLKTKEENRVIRNKKIILNKLQKGCMECGEKNYLCLEFVDNANMIREIEKNINFKDRTAKNVNEIFEKYNVMCFNCMNKNLYENLVKDLDLF